MIIILYLALALHLLIWFGIIGIRFRDSVRKTFRLPGRAASRVRNLPFVTVFVPARDEEHSIRACVESLLMMDYPDFEIIVANDRSIDRTGEILEELKEQDDENRLKIIDVPEPPAGWMGKCHAIWQASKLADSKSKWFLFTDADVLHESDTLRRAIVLCGKEKAPTAVILPHMLMRGFWENAILPVFMHMGMMALRPDRLADPERREFAGIGAFTLLNRRFYDSFGGHESIRGEVIDDMALGMKTKENGGRILLIKDPKAVWLRMYDSLGSIVRGLQKNVQIGVGGGILRSVLVSFSFQVMHNLPLMVFILSFLIWNPWLMIISLAVYLITGLSLYLRIHRAHSLNSLQAIAGYGAGAIVCSYIVLRSAWFTLFRKEIHWRGRVLPAQEQQVRIFDRS